MRRLLPAAAIAAAVLAPIAAATASELLEAGSAPAAASAGQHDEEHRIQLPLGLFWPCG